LHNNIIIQRSVVRRGFPLNAGEEMMQLLGRPVNEKVDMLPVGFPAENCAFEVGGGKMTPYAIP
jgi:hypothetical protein